MKISNKNLEIGKSTDFEIGWAIVIFDENV
jgi:hypothetical protein